MSTCGEIAGYGMLVAVENEHARSAAYLVAFSIYPSIVIFQGFFSRGEHGPVESNAELLSTKSSTKAAQNSMKFIILFSVQIEDTYNSCFSKCVLGKWVTIYYRTW